MVKPKVDYSVYLVTDSTPAILAPGRDLRHVVEQSIRGGATVVQYRDKHASHEEAVAAARGLHEVTKQYGVPLLINDRIDVAVEVGCEGVHIGQDDMAYEEARKVLGHDKIIGVTASSVDEALRASRAGADYLGLGTVYATATKKDTKSIIGPAGVRTILEALSRPSSPPSHNDNPSIPTVCIGGVNASNARAVMAASSPPRKPLDGVAVVSALVSAADPAAAARSLLGQVVAMKAPGVMKAVVEGTPLSHNMTNLVVQNFAANVALSLGASPIMANYAAEAADLARLGGALVINMGTVTPEGLEGYRQALRAYNDAGRPVVLDPVGAGATAVRRQAVKTLLSSGRFTLIKGNENELQTVLSLCPPSPSSSTTTTNTPQQQQQQRGVDSSSTLSHSQRATLVKSLARATNAVILLTGASDFLSDGRRTLRVDGGHEYLGMVTGTGCTLGTAVSAMLAAAIPAGSGDGKGNGIIGGNGGGDALVAAAAGVAVFGIAAEVAARRDDVRGPGTFVPAFLDELYSIRRATAGGDWRWASMVKIEAVEPEVQPEDQQ